MKKGFTLTELLAVIVLLALISFVGYAGISGAREKIKENIYQGTVSAIESGAKLWGEDNRFRLNTSCEVPELDNEGNIDYQKNADGSYILDKNGNKIAKRKSKNDCLEVTVQQLLDTGYVRSKKTCDTNKNKILVDDRKDSSQSDYIINNKKVYIYKENDTVYAVLSDDINPNLTNVCN